MATSLEIKIDKLIRSNRRSIGLEINDKAELIVRIPKSISLKNVQKAIEPKRAWIEKKQAIVRSKNLNYRPKSFTHGEEFLYLGNYYKLRIIKDADQIFHFDDDFILLENYKIKAKALFIYWYKQQSRKIISERVKYFAELHGFSYGHIKITNARKRWGSCTGKNNLNFTWRLVLAPVEIIDSVVVHELVHTKIKNHSKKFWSNVFKIMPEYSEYNKWLKENGYLLNIE